MKKTIISIALCFMAVFSVSLTSCGGKNTGSSDKENVSADKSFNPDDINWELINQFREYRRDAFATDEEIECPVDMDACLEQYRILVNGVAEKGGEVKLGEFLKEKYPNEDIYNATLFMAAFNGFVTAYTANPAMFDSMQLPNSLVPLTKEQVEKAVAIKKGGK